MTHAEHLQILRLPAQLAAARRWLAMLDNPAVRRPPCYVRARRRSAEAKVQRLTDRARRLGLRELAR